MTHEIKGKLFYVLFKDECFVYMCACAPHEYLVPMEVRIGHQIPYHQNHV